MLELLLVLAIIGLVASLAGLGVGSGSQARRVEEAARHFVGVARYALDEAALGGIDLGLFIGRDGVGADAPHSYRWLRRAPGGWAPVVLDETLSGARHLPRGVALRLEVEQGDAPLGLDGGDGAAIGGATVGSARTDGATGGDANGNRAARRQPQVVFYGSGETTPGVMTWLDSASGAVLWRLEWDLLGRMALRRGDG